jgi:CheY-like chemotaxis protein/nitrogen-specific signal transduction histidine kinase
MPLTRLRVRSALLTLRPFAQILSITAAFALMVVASYFFTLGNERRHLDDTAESMFFNIEAQLTSDLRELETMMGIVSESVRRLILGGASFEEIKAHITGAASYAGEAGVSGFVSVFAFFDIPGWQPRREGFNTSSPETNWRELEEQGLFIIGERDWYSLALEANGGIILTEPYADVVTREPVLSYARALHGEDGSVVAVIGLNFLLHRLYAFSSEFRGHFENTWMLLDSNLTIVTHSSENFVGLPLRDSPSGTRAIAADLEQGIDVIGYRYINHLGEDRILTVRRLDNGWYLGVATLAAGFYENMRGILIFLSVFGLFMAILLSYVLMRFQRSKDRAETHVRLLFDSMPLGASIIDEQFKHRNVNRETVRLFGLTDQREFSEHFFRFSPEYQPDGRKSSQAAVELMQKAFDEGYCRFEWLHQDVYGGPIPCEITLVRVERKGLRCVSSFTRDLRGEKTALAEKDYAEQSNRHKSAFLANMSHEIRTPMNAILGIAEIQLRDELLSPSTEDAFTKICESGGLLLDIINDILDLSKIEADKLELVLSKYDVPGLISDSVQITCHHRQEKPVVFNLLVDPDTPLELIGDELRIKQVLNNILSNAFKYTDQGSVELSVSSIPISADETVLVLRVADTGLGMTEQQLANLFSQYTRFTTTRSIVGAGLGMSIAKRLIDLMGGTVQVDSSPGSGSVFTVRLPQKLGGTAVCGVETSEKLSDLRFQMGHLKKKAQFSHEYMPYGSVLIVDDIESNLLVSKGMLAPYGLQMDYASSGLQAVEKIKSGSEYDIIFMDHLMPKMDGVEAAQIIRGLGYTGHIVALTANALTGHEDVFLQSGFDGFISKPIDSRALNDLLNTMIRNQKPPEVVEEARRSLQAPRKDHDDPSQTAAALNDVKRAFVLDASNTVAILNDIIEKMPSLSAEDFKTFTTALHGMKTALSNIGEPGWSIAALRLEQAGREMKLELMSDEIPAFLKALGNLIGKLHTSPVRSSPETISPADRFFLQKELQALKQACAAFDRPSAQKALAALAEKQWPDSIAASLDDISTLLLHSAFKKISAAADKLSETAGKINAD